MNKKLVIIGGCIVLIAGFLFVLFKPSKSEEPRKTRIAGFDEMVDQVIVRKNITYSKEYKNSKLDVYIPKDNVGVAKPTIFWAHGGAFVGGDKKSVSDYCVMLASQGYVVVNINYSLAPEYEYPTPVIQIGEAYMYMINHAEKYDLDMDKVVFGGDSAGGQIMGQFVNVQVNEEYADLLNLTPVVEDASIKAVIFFSALLDLNKFNENENEYANHVFNKSAQAYFGLKEWKNTDKVNQANIVGNVSEHYPPTYLTDGNTASFQEQAEELAYQLKKNDVPVTTTFFPVEDVELRHEYQFNMQFDEAVENYKRVTTFLKKYLKNAES